jgi:hypothetical protein
MLNVEVVHIMQHASACCAARFEIFDIKVILVVAGSVVEQGLCMAKTGFNNARIMKHARWSF